MHRWFQGNHYNFKSEIRNREPGTEPLYKANYNHIIDKLRQLIETSLASYHTKSSFVRINAISIYLYILLKRYFPMLLNGFMT